MPKRKDISSILILGSGPIVIGQACEFDYSGTQAVKALREEGYRVLLVNSNPATIMTDPELADRTYVEPIEPAFVTKILEEERPDAILPTLGGQTALNTAIQLSDSGVLERLGVEMIGASAEVIRRAEDREQFQEIMQSIGLEVAKGRIARTLEEALEIKDEVGLPAVIRPSFTMGGSGGGVAYNVEEFTDQVEKGLDLSLTTEVLVEESILGWKEYELEVMRDQADNAIVVCTIENFDPMGVHTGDSLTVAPAQTLTDKEYQILRDASLAIIRAIGVETGGSNIQFATHPETGRVVVIEMNPRVSRSSALASKATGFPIAKFAAKLAVGYTLDEIDNDITKKTPACFEPTIDYCVVKAPRWAFEKFPESEPSLGIQMKSVGETMAIGRTFPEALQKALRGLEIGRSGLHSIPGDVTAHQDESLGVPRPDRMFSLYHAIVAGRSRDEIAQETGIDPWFLAQLERIIHMEKELRTAPCLEELSDDVLYQAKRLGFSDAQMAMIYNVPETAVRSHRKERNITPVYKRVDTCGAEFEAFTPYYYSTYEEEDEVVQPSENTVMILGSGPNRIGQGIEFDYCCVHAAYALKEIGYESVMVNSNPETVSTDYDTSDHLFFEPLTRENVLDICDRISPKGVILQFGGQTPLNLAKALADAGVPILGTTPDSIDRAENRERFADLLDKLGLSQPPCGLATNAEEAKAIAARVGYPVMVRPSYVLGGRAMEIVENEELLTRYLERAVNASPAHPVLVDKFLEEAIEVDVDAVSDGENVVVAGVMEHIEMAGVHSGDSTCILPTYTLSSALVDEMCKQTKALAKELGVVGLMNIQFAVRNNQIYVIEVNPRASRTVPYVSKAIGLPIAKIAAKVMAGVSLAKQGVTEIVWPTHYSVKKPVFPFRKFPGSDVILGPEMRSTGEVMGMDKDLGIALAKAQFASNSALPTSGKIFLSVRDSDKRDLVSIAQKLMKFDFELVATRGTLNVLRQNGLEVEAVAKIGEGRPDVIDMLKNKEISLIFNTPGGQSSRTDEARIRSLAVMQGIPVITTIAGAQAAVSGIEAFRRSGPQVSALQSYYVESPTSERAPVC